MHSQLLWERDYGTLRQRHTRVLCRSPRPLLGRETCTGNAGFAPKHAAWAENGTRSPEIAAKASRPGTGAAVALGPIAGGFLLEHFWWGSVLLINVPICAIAIFLGWKILPNSKDADAPRLDIGGLVLSIFAVGTLV